VRESLLGGEVEQDARAAHERGAVVQHEARLRRKPREQQVPHHPVAGGVIEESVARSHVELQLVHLEARQQRAARAVHDALGLAGGAGGEQDVERVVERHLGVFDVARGKSAQPLLQHHRVRNVRYVRPLVEIRRDDDLAHARQLGRDLAHPIERIMALAVVDVAVGAEQHLGLDLPEAVQHAVGSEVRRAR
jgi:hypothetical protein